jgi:hypothetical protein
MKAVVVATVVLVAVASLAAVMATRTGIGQRLLSGGPGPVAGPVPPPPAATIPPRPRLKLAFIGDTGSGPTFEQVLALIRGEQSDGVVHMGDATYDDETPEQFWGVVDRVLGHQFPYFLAEGNHDRSQWPALAAHAQEHLPPGVAAAPPRLVDGSFDLVFAGVSFVFLGEAVHEDDPFHVIERFARDEHVWKVCAWHKNQRRLQIGGKGNEMGWGVYESCRLMGAMVMTGHEHSYHRTRTLASMVEQQVDPTCSDAGNLCVRPGAVPVFVSGLGGRSIRDQERCPPASYPYGCKGEWAFIYTSTQGARFGALFLTFDGPRKARGYFKTVDGQVVDQFQLTVP